MTREEAFQKWEKLGAKGIVISVDAFCAHNGGHFDIPYGANSFEHAIEIAEKESLERGWIPTLGSIW